MGCHGDPEHKFRWSRFFEVMGAMDAATANRISDTTQQLIQDRFPYYIATLKQEAVGVLCRILVASLLARPLRCIIEHPVVPGITKSTWRSLQKLGTLSISEARVVSMPMFLARIYFKSRPSPAEQRH
eukprot:m51a1_g13594 hypothetical protein (128) ;mRNA; f:451-834